MGVIWLTLADSATAGTLKCPPDSVKVGNVCIDLYEASVWQIDSAKKALVKKVQQGKVKLADLTAGGATQLGPDKATLTCTGTEYPANFPNTGNWTPVSGSRPPSPGVYAVSIPGVLPSSCITWFQANQACALSGKRLIRNGEWQRAAASTPDSGNGPMDCNTQSGGPSNTGSRTNCKSAWGVFDMVGNMYEWVEDWADRAKENSQPDACTDWTTAVGFPGGDVSCFGGPGGSGGVPPPPGDTSTLPGALIRGGFFDSGAIAGVFAVHADFVPSDSAFGRGFRCAR